MVYPSVVHGYGMGNIQNYEHFEDLWNSERADKARELVQTKGVPAWMICTARTAIRKHPLSVGMWVLKNKMSGVKL